MKLNKELKTSIREIFEKPEYYGRSLNDVEVQEIADNLVSFGDLLMQYTRDHCRND